MRFFFTIAFLFICNYLLATNYYVSSLGNNANNGTSMGTSWLSISKVNSSMGLINAGDSILFRSGDTFDGSLIITKSGTTALPIVVSSYGVGAKPIISGFETLSGWANVGGNIWQSASPTIALKNSVNVLTIDGNPMAVGRTDWQPYTSATVTQLTAVSLTSNFVGAQIVMRKDGFTAEKALITAQSGTTVTYIRTQGLDNGSANPPRQGNPGLKFFLQRFLGSLDTQGEWFYDTVAHVMKLYSTSNPSGFVVKASYVDTVINLGSRTNITLNNLTIEGAGMYGVENLSGTNITVKNCSFLNNTRPIYGYNSRDFIVDNCTYLNSFCNAIYVSNNHNLRVTITNNTVQNTGQLIGMGLFWSDYNLKGIIATVDTISNSSNYINIINNNVKTSGHAGIQFQGSNATIRRNVVDTFDNQLDDNGGIYTFYSNTGIAPDILFNRLIDSNFISNAIGATISGSGVDVAGYYLDDRSWHVTGLHNSVWNIPGIGVQWNSPKFNTIRDMTLYNCDVAIAIGLYYHTGDPLYPLTNNEVKQNVEYQKTNTQSLVSHAISNRSLVDSSALYYESIKRMAVMDSNYLANFKNQSFTYLCFVPPSTNCTRNYNLTQWRDSFQHEIHSQTPPVTYTGTNANFYPNPSYSLLTINFTGFRKIDPKGNIYNNQATVGRWSSIILIDDGLANQPPTANAGGNKTITLPTNSVTVIGSGTDPDGTIASYHWDFITGPGGSTINSPNSATTLISTLVQGTYTFQLTVTDNQGATGTNQMQIFVLAAPINQLPTANAGADQSIQLPTTVVSLAGTGADSDGTISSFSWNQINGPNTGIITSPNSANTTVTNLIAGTYRFRLTVTDNQGGQGFDTVQVIVSSSPPPVNPTANAGVDQIFSLPTDSANLVGSGNDQDGFIVSYGWVKISGGSATIVTPTSAITKVTGLSAGVYLFELTVTDNSSLTGKDTMQITVVAQNQPPIVDAGPDLILTLPSNDTTVIGHATDPEGVIDHVLWTQISGPNTATIGTPSDSTTTIGGLIEGTYIFQYAVTDSGNVTGTDVMQITVLPVPNVPPVADAGKDQQIVLPIDSVTLMGHGTDNDGTIVGYHWTFIDGPATYTIDTPNDSTTKVYNLVTGTYRFRLTVTDDKGATGSDIIIITVYAALANSVELKGYEIQASP